MEITVKIEAPGLMEAIIALAEQLQTHNALQTGQPAPTGPVTVAPVDVISAPIIQPVTPPATQSVPQTPPAPTAPTAPVVPTADAPTYTQQDMAMACVQLMDLKGQARIMEIMGQFGVQALTMLDKSQYGALAQVLRNEGVNI